MTMCLDHLGVSCKNHVCADGNAHLAVGKQAQGTVGGQECWAGEGCGPQRK